MTVIDVPEILYQDEDLIVVNKPANLLSVPGRGTDKQDCVASRVQQQFPSALIVHRLDYDTSGILLMALSKQAQSAMGRIFQQREISKTYQAIVYGTPATDHGEIDLPMRCDFERRPLQIIDHDQGKAALTRWRLLDSDPDRSRIALYPHTGRSHQLRLHMQSIGHPILGDNLYRNEHSYEMSERLLLHATELQFTHPFSQQPLSIHCPPPF